MAKYIDRDELKAAILKRLGISGEQYLTYSEKVLVDVINKMPLADEAGRKTGKWICEPGHIPKCSNCGRYSDDADTGEAKFCAFCGCKMEETNDH